MFYLFKGDYTSMRYAGSPMKTQPLSKIPRPSTVSNRKAPPKIGEKIKETDIDSSVLEGMRIPSNIVVPDSLHYYMV